jgi:hypothetical protein
MNNSMNSMRFLLASTNLVERKRAGSTANTKQGAAKGNGVVNLARAAARNPAPPARAHIAYGISPVAGRLRCGDRRYAIRHKHPAISSRGAKKSLGSSTERKCEDLFPVPCSLFLFAVPCSLFAVPCSLFAPFYIVTHPEVRAVAEERTGEVAAAFDQLDRARR